MMITNIYIEQINTITESVTDINKYIYDIAKIIILFFLIVSLTLN